MRCPAMPSLLRPGRHLALGMLSWRPSPRRGRLSRRSGGPVSAWRRPKWGCSATARTLARRGARPAETVNLHDCSQDALRRAGPDGLNDGGHQQGPRSVGGAPEGRMVFPQAEPVLILADAGGSHGCRPRQWKYPWQDPLRGRVGLTVIVGHSPPGDSQWSPIAQRWCRDIRLTGAGKPLRTGDTRVGDIHGPTTTGLEGRAPSPTECTRPACTFRTQRCPGALFTTRPSIPPPPLPFAHDGGVPRSPC
jgi:hypothetical protein